ncbi:hypothetical protein ACFOWB_18930 [Chenggangzhangella methanolivorans]
MTPRLDGLSIKQVCALKTVEAMRLRELDLVLSALEDDGLIEWKERAWALTEAGKFAVRRNTDPRSGEVVRA